MQSPVHSGQAASAARESHRSLCPCQEELVSQVSGPSLFYLPSALDGRLPHSVFRLYSMFPFCFSLPQTKKISRPLLWKAQVSQSMAMRRGKQSKIHKELPVVSAQTPGLCLSSARQLTLTLWEKTIIKPAKSVRARWRTPELKLHLQCRWDTNVFS